MADEQDLQTPAETPQEAVAVEPVADQAAEQEPAAQEPQAQEASPEENAQAAEVDPAAEADAAEPESTPEGGSDDDMLAALKDLPEEDKGSAIEDIDFSQTSVSKAEFQQLSEPAGEPEGRNIELLMDVNLPISIELGRTKMSIADILALGPGSVVELNKLAGEPVDLLVNQKVVAKGEVVVIDENFGVRVTQLMTPEERLKSLGEES